MYISHLHADHAGGIEYLGFCSFFDTNKEKIQLIGNRDIIREGWKHTWSGGMRSYQGKVLTLEDFFDVQMIPQNGRFIWEDIEFQIVQSVHIMDGYAIVPSYGLMMNQGQTGIDKYSVFFTTDTQFNPNQIMDFYKQADLIVQDCETYPFKSGVHAHFDELCTLPEDIRKRMVLVHYADNCADRNGSLDEDWVAKALKAELRFANLGEVIEC